MSRSQHAVSITSLLFLIALVAVVVHAQAVAGGEAPYFEAAQLLQDLSLSDREDLATIRALKYIEYGIILLIAFGAYYFLVRRPPQRRRRRVRSSEHRHRSRSDPSAWGDLLLVQQTGLPEGEPPPPATPGTGSTRDGPLESDRPGILVIEDFPEIRNILETALCDRFDVYLAGTGEEGVRLAKNHAPQLIWLDLGLPGTSGGEVLRQIRCIPAMKDVPVVICSSQAPDVVHEAGRSLEAAAVLGKPFSIEGLSDRLFGIYADWRASRQQKQSGPGMTQGG